MKLLKFQIFPIKCYIRLADPMPYFVGQPQYRRVYLRADLKMKDGKQGAKVEFIEILSFIL